MRKQLTKTVENIIKTDDKSVLMLGDIGVFGFRNTLKNYPDRVYNIGILEQATIGMAAGLSKVGMIPIVHTIAPFIVERAFEQIKVDFGYQKLNGNFISVGASYDYSALGCTHYCPGDVQLLDTISNMDIILPGTSQEFDTLFNQTYNNGNPSYYRLSEYENETSQDVTYGKGKLIKKGKLATIVVVGNMLDNVLKAVEDLDMTILYYTTIKPFDYELIKNNLNNNIIICEPYYEGTLNYYISEAINEIYVIKSTIFNMFLKPYRYKIYNIGIPHMFIEKYGTKDEIDEYLGLSVQSIKKRIINHVEDNR